MRDKDARVKMLSRRCLRLVYFGAPYMTTANVTDPQRASGLGPFLAVLLVVLAAIYLAACTFFCLQQDPMTFPAPREYSTATPLNAGIPFEDLHTPVNGSE